MSEGRRIAGQPPHLRLDRTAKKQHAIDEIFRRAYVG